MTCLLNLGSRTIELGACSSVPMLGSVAAKFGIVGGAEMIRTWVFISAGWMILLLWFIR
jgi:hypothetical protein